MDLHASSSNDTDETGGDDFARYAQQTDEDEFLHQYPSGASDAEPLIITVTDGPDPGDDESLLERAVDFDEYDRMVAKGVGELLTELDEAFHSEAVHARIPQEETDEWKLAFPHLRVVGRQLLPTSDAAVQFVPTQPPGHPLPQPPQAAVGAAPDEAEERDLPLQHRLESLAISTEAGTAVSSRQRKFATEADEEVLAADGCQEELLALDSPAAEPDSSEAATARPMLPASGKSRPSAPLDPSESVFDEVRTALLDRLLSSLVPLLAPAIADVVNTVARARRVPTPPEVPSRRRSLPGRASLALPGQAEELEERDELRDAPLRDDPYDYLRSGRQSDWDDDESYIADYKFNTPQQRARLDSRSTCLSLKLGPVPAGVAQIDARFTGQRPPEPTFKPQHFELKAKKKFPAGFHRKHEVPAPQPVVFPQQFQRDPLKVVLSDASSFAMLPIVPAHLRPLPTSPVFRLAAKPMHTSAHGTYTITHLPSLNSRSTHGRAVHQQPAARNNGVHSKYWRPSSAGPTPVTPRSAPTSHTFGSEDRQQQALGWAPVSSLSDDETSAGAPRGRRKAGTFPSINGSKAARSKVEKVMLHAVSLPELPAQMIRDLAPPARPWVPPRKSKSNLSFSKGYTL